MTDNYSMSTAIAALDPEVAACALARFVEINPGYDGADWGDVIEILFDSDSHLHLTEETDTIAAAVDVVTRWWAGMIPTVQTVCRVVIPPSTIDPPGILGTNPTVLRFFEWLRANGMVSVTGTLSSGPHMFVADFPVEYQDRIVAWFRENGPVSYDGVQSSG